MTESQKLKKYMKCAIKGTILSIVTCILILAVLAILIQKGSIPSSLMEPCVIVTVIIATCVGGSIAVRLQGRTAAITALLSGLLGLLLITTVAFAENGLRFLNAGYAKMLVSIFAGSLTGGMLGTHQKSVKKRK